MTVRSSTSQAIGVGEVIDRAWMAYEGAADKDGFVPSELRWSDVDMMSLRLQAPNGEFFTYISAPSVAPDVGIDALAL